MEILLHEKTRQILTKLEQKHFDVSRFDCDIVELDSIFSWFENKNKNESKDKQTQFLIEALNAALLKDIRNKILPKEKKEKDTNRRWGKVKFFLLAVAGTLFFGCEGFDGIITVLSLFKSIPTVAVFAIGTVFSLLSIIVFYSFDLLAISKHLGVKVSKAGELLDNYLDQLKQIKAIRESILIKYNKMSPVELEEVLRIIEVLVKRHEELDDARQKLKDALNNKGLKFAKIITAGIAGIIFFSGGYFAGQTVALSIAGLFLTTVATTFWPVVVVSLVVALAAFSVYWFVERPGIENLISRWVGLDKDKIDILCEPEAVEEEKSQLQNLQSIISGTCTAQKEFGAMETRFKELEVGNKILKHQLQRHDPTFSFSKDYSSGFFPVSESEKKSSMCAPQSLSFS